MDAPLDFRFVRRREHLTFKANLRETRYGWLRLTPAYSVHLVRDLLARHATRESKVLDPFCGTGTTALVCAEQGIPCDTTDINPFLVWLAGAKTRNYAPADLQAAAEAAADVAEAMRNTGARASWTPPIHQIEKWWNAGALEALGRGMAALREARPDLAPGTADLLHVAFCRTLIDHANVSFGHPSMSFSKGPQETTEPAALTAKRVVDTWLAALQQLAQGARIDLKRPATVVSCDARHLDSALPLRGYDCVITSPPYPNRMSYVRELRPYMYWMGYLVAARDAGELDWQAMGGTWGCATSNVGRWRPEPGAVVPSAGFDEMIARIRSRSPLLSRYVHKYFQDFVDHTGSLARVVAPGGTVHYVVGNSKFYDVVVSVEQIIGDILGASGFDGVEVEPIRKRNSKKELYEFLVHARHAGAGRALGPGLARGAPGRDSEGGATTACA